MTFQDRTPPSRGEAERQEWQDKAREMADQWLWWSDHNNLHLLAEYLYAYCDMSERTLIDVLEKPWKWTPEFIDAVEDEALESGDEDVTAERLLAERLHQDQERQPIAYEHVYVDEDGIERPLPALTEEMERSIFEVVGEFVYVEETDTLEVPDRFGDR